MSLRFSDLGFEQLGLAGEPGPLLATLHRFEVKLDVLLAARGRGRIDFRNLLDHPDAFGDGAVLGPATNVQHQSPGPQPATLDPAVIFSTHTCLLPTSRLRSNANKVPELPFRALLTGNSTQRLELTRT
jgi:hypothetical protein